jgi:Domain of unknown function (DUF4124)
MMKLSTAALVCLALSAPFAEAAGIYQWVDDQGRVQFSDKVPDAYKPRAKEVEVERFKAAPRARPGTAVTAAAPAPATGSDAAPLPLPLPPGVRPAPRPRAPSGPGPVAGKEAECAVLRQRYADSQRCFAPFVTATGGVKAEAFTRCTPVADPSPQCGIPSLP